MTDEELYIETLQPDYRKPGAKLVQQLTESDTPRTELFFTNPPTTEEAQDFANKLERELNEARKENEWLKLNDTALGASRDAARQERDQLRKVVDELAYELKDLRELILDRFEIKLNLYNSLPHVQQRSKK